jgi:glycosyltransferase involved in cell wall biosynthesis
MKVTIVGEGIGGIGSGLGYFLHQSIGVLTRVEPDWHFEIITGASFQELREINAANLDVRFWDNTSFRRFAGSLLSRFLQDGPVDAACQKMTRYLPTNRLRAACGNLKAIWASHGTPDVVWIPHYVIGPFTRHLSPAVNVAQLGVPVVMTIHDIHPVFFPEDWPASSLERFWNELVPFAQQCAHVITHSEFQRQGLIERVGLQPEKVSVISCPPLFRPDSLWTESTEAGTREVLEHYGIRKPFALYPGSNTISHKNHIRLILAWKLLSQELGSECPMLVCTARNPMWSALKSLIDALSLEDKVIFTDIIDKPSLIKLYKSCLLTVVPTLYEGGGSGPVVEAILAGKPVVCSDIPQIREQLSFASCTVEMFNPESVDSIAASLLHAFDRIPELEAQALRNREVLSLDFEESWRAWAGSYAQRFRQAVGT